MGNTPDIGRTKLRYLEWIFLNLCLYGAFFVFFGPITSLFGQRYSQVRLSRYYFVVTNFLASCYLVFLAQKFEAVTADALVWFWVVSPPAFPVAGSLLMLLKLFSYFSKPKTLKEQLADAEKRLSKSDEKRSLSAAHRDERGAQPGALRLGSFVKGDLLPEGLGIYNRENWVFLNEEILDQHLFLLGTTGSGKSETIKRLIYEIMLSTDRDVFFVDGKGDEKLANDVRSMAYQHGRGLAPVFRLGHGTHGAIYDGFRGGEAEIANRIGALVGIPDVEGNAQYYADINRDLLQLACYAPEGPPRNFEQLRGRIRGGWLLETYADDPVERSTVKELEARDIQGLARRIRPLAREFGRCVGDDGFALEETRCAIFSIRTQSLSDTSRRFLDFLVEDIKDFIGKRQQRPAVLIIDEFGQFPNNNILALLTMARSYNFGVILATQDVASLKGEDTQKMVLANTRTKILMATDYPEDVGVLAGTIYQIEASLQHDEGNPTGQGSSRIQHAFKIDMNEAAKLKPGEAFVIRQRHVTKVKVRAIGEIEHVASQEPEERKTTEQTEEPKAKKRPPRL